MDRHRDVPLAFRDLRRASKRSPRLAKGVLAFVQYLLRNPKTFEAWPASRRMGTRAVWCRFGCMAIGGDDIRHYLCCPVVCPYTRGRRAATPCWATTGGFRLALGISLATRRHTLVNVVRTYLVYALFCTYRKSLEWLRVRLSGRCALVRRCRNVDALAVLRRRRQRGTRGIGDDAPHRKW